MQAGLPVFYMTRMSQIFGSNYRRVLCQKCVLLAQAEQRWISSSHTASTATALNIVGVQQAIQSAEFPVVKVWKAGVPSRVSFFLWLALIGRALTVDHLQRKGIDS